MFKKYLTLLVAILVINLTISGSVFANNKEGKDAKFTEKVKTEITKLGIGTDAKVKVKLKDGTKLKGYVAEINEDNFVIKNLENDNATVVSYANAKQVKGNNLSTGAIIAITVGVTLAIVLLLFYNARNTP